MAISVPVLPTPALQGDRHRLDEPGRTYNTYLLLSINLNFLLTCSEPVWILWRASPGPSSDGGS